MIIDFHTHVFPERIAEKTIEKLSFVSGGLIPQTNVTLSGLKQLMKKDGIDKSVVLAIATNEKQQTAVNDYIKSCEGEDIIPFGSVYPHAENALEELERIKAMGLKGIKLHPEYQGFFVDDPKMKPIYKAISELSLPLILHSGKDPGFPFPYHCTPERLAKALSWLDTPVIAAHWGALQLDEDTINYLAGLPVYIDTSMGYGIISRYSALKIIEKHGTNKLLFASDTPWGTPQRELRFLDTLGLSDTERRDILWNNAMNIFGK